MASSFTREPHLEPLDAPDELEPPLAVGGDGRRLRAGWVREGARFLVHEPDEGELERHAPALAAWYGDPHNQAMMTMEPRPIAAADVCAIHARLRGNGGRTFLLFRDGALVGDADLRRIEAPRAEFAILVGPKGRGFGTVFSILLGALGFRALGLREIYLTIIPANEAGRRCYEKVGYQIDHGPVARSYAELDDDIPMVLTPDALRARHGAALDAIAIGDLGPVHS